MVQRIRWFLLLVFVATGLLFVVQNTHPVDVEFVAWTRSPPLSVLLLGSLAFGFLLGAVITRSMLRSRQKRAAAMDKAQAKASEAEKRAAKAEATLEAKAKEESVTPPQ